MHPFSPPLGYNGYTKPPPTEPAGKKEKHNNSFNLSFHCSELVRKPQTYIFIGDNQSKRLLSKLLTSKVKIWPNFYPFYPHPP